MDNNDSGARDCRMAQTTVGGKDQYTLRLYEPGDRSAFLALYGETFGGGSEKWFDWKYVENPATEHVPIVVATDGDELVGARPCVPFRMRISDHTVSAIRFGDTMVDVDHRRRGLFTKMTRRMIQYYAALEPSFGFNHPNDFSLPGYRQMGGRVIGQFPVAYRIQNPSALLAGRLTGPVARGVSMTTPLTRAYLDGRERLVEIESGISVTREDTVPVETLTALYDVNPPDGIHAERTLSFYEWRFQNPRWQYTTYVARRENPVAAIVTGTQQLGGATVTTLTETVPMAGNADRGPAFSALIERILEDTDDSDLLAYNGQAIPESVLRSFGFHRDTHAPLSWLAHGTQLVAHELGGDVSQQWRVNGVNLLDASNWTLSFCEQDAR